MDRRWERFTSRSFQCPCCARSFGGVFDIAFDHPDMWPHDKYRDAGVDILRVGKDALGPDFCLLGDDRFIRCTLPIPVLGTDDRFNFGVWGSVSADTFNQYIAAYKTDDYSQLDPFFAWLCNKLPGVDMEEQVLPCTMQNFSSTLRPELWVHEGAHGLAGLQRHGMTFDQLLDIYAASGTDIRPHLGDA